MATSVRSRACSERMIEGRLHVDIAHVERDTSAGLFTSTDLDTREPSGTTNHACKPPSG